MANNIPYPRGSKWRKWDLHVHTPASALNNQFTGSNEAEKWVKYFDRLSSLSDIAVLGVTDYFSIDGYLKVREFKNQGNLANIELVLPNVELRILPVTNTETPINIHVVFNPAIINDLESRFFSSLEFPYADEIFKCIKNDLIKLGRKYRNNNALPENEAYKMGVEQFKVSIEKIQAIFQKNKGLATNSLVIVSNSSRNGAYGIKHSSLAATREEIYRLAHCIFSSNPNDCDYFLGKGSDSKEEIIRKYGYLKACIHGSDAHSLERVCCPDQNRFTWIKANPTFEGLKQIIYEPGDRVRIQENNPETFKIANSYDSIKISNSKINAELEIKEIELPLNRDLITVIGGKGTGKTALLDLIANCYLDRVNSDDKNSFARRIASDGQTLKIELKFLDNSEFKKTLTENKFISTAEIEYIPQGQIENLITKYRDFHDFLQKLIFESSKIKDSVLLFEYEKILQSIDRCRTEIIKVNREIYDIEVATEKKLFEKVQKDIKLKTTEKNNLEVEIEIFKKQLTDVGAKEAKKVQQELSLQQIKRNQLLKLENLIDEVFMKFEVIMSINDSLTKIYTLLKNLDMSVGNTKLLEYRDIESELVNIEKTIQPKLSQVNKVIEETRSKTAQLDSRIKKHSELLKQHEDAKLEIVRLSEKLNDLNKMKELLMEKREIRLDLFKQLLKDKLQIRVKYKQIINAFSIEARGIMSGLEFDSSLTFDVNAFEMEGEDIVDLRSLKTSKEGKISVTQSTILEKLMVFINLFANLENQNETEEENLVNDFVNELSNVLQCLIEIRKSIRTNLHLYEWLFADYFVLNTAVYFNKIALDKLSLGQKCTVLLKVYLAQGKNPILIDQPDDNLDNKFIMDELVTALRQAKKNRQVIIASNNANIVVNSDAEQLIVAEFDKGIISYIAGSIENPQIKEKAIHILEGGPKAFENREKKYGLKH